MSLNLESNCRRVAIVSRPNETRNNQRKLEELTEALNRSLKEALDKGFFGKVTIELAIQDGSIGGPYGSIPNGSRNWCLGAKR